MLRISLILVGFVSRHWWYCCPCRVSGPWRGTTLQSLHGYRWILVFIFCLISILCSSLSDEASKIKFLNIQRNKHGHAIYRIVAEKFSLKNPKIYKGWRNEVINILPPSNFAVFDCCYFFCYNCKELKLNCSNCSNLPAISIFEQVLFVYITTSSVCYLVC